MTFKKKRLDKAKMELIAREATKCTLSDYTWITPKQEKHLALGTFLSETKCDFELYLSGAKPTDAIVLTRATVDRWTGDVKVAIFLPQK